jgi:hypothetical protein
MWAADGKLFVLGGRALASAGVPRERMLPEEDNFWSFDMGQREWNNEGGVLSGNAATNMPSGQYGMPTPTIPSLLVVSGIRFSTDKTMCCHHGNMLELFTCNM